MIALSNRTLAELPPTVGRPGYDRARLKPGIVHFGVGNFHRAHQATYLDALFDRGKGLDWAIVGAGVRPEDEAMRADLEAQDWLTTVVEQDAAGSTARVIASMSGFLPIGDPAACVQLLTDPAIRIVSLTVTEGGYFIDPATGACDASHPALVADAARPDRPTTVFGLILAGLKARRDRGMQPFAVMSCDNLPHNGRVTANAIVGLAGLFDRGLAEWTAQNVAFPNGMVDRITPATGDRERRLLAEQFSVADARPVFCERFTQWVLEDRFPSGRPPLEEVGVTFVDDVSLWEQMKIRMLNGGHATIAYPAGLLGIHFVHEAMQHPLIRAFLAKVENEEIIPAVPPVPGTDLGKYRRLLEDRFANPKIGDTIRRLCFDGSNRQPKFILPTVRDRLAAGASVTGLALVSALWCRYCFGVSESGVTIAPNDPSWARLRTAALAARSEPQAWLRLTDIFGTLGENEGYARVFSKALSTLWREGTEATLQSYLGNLL